MDFSLVRSKHCWTVAKKMKKMASQNPEIYDYSPDEMFVLGLLHDIGYEFSKQPSEHAHRGGEMLQSQGYKFWQEVYYHGDPKAEYNSAALDLLNIADLTTGPNGEEMTVEERILDIIKRYGKGSLQEVETIELAKRIKER